VSRARSVVVEARAKINLALAVGPRRADGYHDLATIYQSISLSDTLTIRPRPRGFTLTVRFESAAVRDRVPRPAKGRLRAKLTLGADNLVLRAARLLAERRGLTGGASFHLVKRIPARAGLGGGSADAAAALMGLAASNRLRLGRDERLALASELGSDVPFAVLGGTAMGTGRGDRLTSLKLAKPFRALIAVPSWGIGTAEAYRDIDRKRIPLTAQWSANLRSVQVLGRERLRVDRAMRLGNTFESVLGGRRKEFEALRRRLEDAGVTRTRLTGSGSAVVGLLPEGRVSAAAVRRYQGTEVLYLVRSMGRGWKLISRS
jgi:4-diphosphocytidyl-2-C-methyl-D-erythritol kinase